MVYLSRNLIELELKRLRKGKPGRPFNPKNHYTRRKLNELRDIKLEEAKKYLITFNSEC